MGNNSSKHVSITSLIVGGLLGAGIALLVAPQSGKKTRREIAYLGKVTKNKAEAIQLQLRHVCEDWTDKVMEEVQEGLNRSREWTDKTQHRIFDVLDSAREYVRKEIRDVMETQD